MTASSATINCDERLPWFEPGQAPPGFRGDRGLRDTLSVTGAANSAATSRLRGPGVAAKLDARMKRDARLRGLSSEHHHALVLARTVTTLVADGRADEAARQLAERFERELEPHFATEEELLLPALREVGEVALVERTEADHAFLRAEASAARAGHTARLVAFAERLTDHVRFEERELFPRCEATLPAAVLDAVARRSPH